MRPRPRVVATLLLALAMLSAWPAGAKAQSSPIRVEVDRTTLSTDERLTLTVTVSGSSAVPPPTLPPLDGFTVVSRSSTSQISTVFGKTSARVVHQYRLQPVRAGDLTIGAMTVTLGGTTHTTQPIAVEVTQGSRPSQQVLTTAPSGPAATELVGQDFFVEAEVDDADPYVGQQLTYVVRFYRAANFVGQLRYGAPAFTRFWNATDPGQYTYMTKAAGRTYNVIEIRTVLFPTVAGEATIEPATVSLPGGVLRRRVEFKTEPVTLSPSPLPDGAPPSFNGAVGRFELSARIDSSRGVANQPLKLALTLSGVGNIDTLGDPRWPEMPQWRSFEGQATIASRVVDGRLSGSRVYERVLVPEAPGEFTIPPITYSYLDPDQGVYRTASTDQIAVSIAPAAPGAAVAVLPGAQDRVERLATDIRHIKPAPVALGTGGRPLTERGLYWATWAVAPAALVLAIGWRRRRRQAGGDGALARSLGAEANANEMLARARRDGEDPYAAAGKTLSIYLGDRLARPVSGMTRTSLADLLAGRGIAPHAIEQVAACMAASEGGRFAPGVDRSGPGEDLLSKTESLIAELEEELDR